MGNKREMKGPEVCEHTKRVEKGDLFRRDNELHVVEGVLGGGGRVCGRGGLDVGLGLLGGAGTLVGRGALRGQKSTKLRRNGMTNLLVLLLLLLKEMVVAEHLLLLLLLGGRRLRLDREGGESRRRGKCENAYGLAAGHGITLSENEETRP